MEKGNGYPDHFQPEVLGEVLRPPSFLPAESDRGVHHQPVTIIKITAQTPTFSDQSYGVPYQEAKDAGFLELVRSPANISTFAGLHNNCL